MNDMMFWKRRFLLGTGLAAVLGAVAGQAGAQQDPQQPAPQPPQPAPAPPQPQEPQWEIGNILERLASAQGFDAIFSDVRFVYSWRVARPPRGYESEGDWYLAARNQLAAVFNEVAPDPVGFVRNAEGRVRELIGTGRVVYADNRNGFSEFLRQVGVAPEGPAGQRMVQSMLDYLALAGSANSADVETARRRSFFWPFC